MQRAIVEVIGHKAHGLIPEPGSVVIARVSDSAAMCIIRFDANNLQSLILYYASVKIFNR